MTSLSSHLQFTQSTLALPMSQVSEGYGEWVATATDADQAGVVKMSIDHVTDPANSLSPTTRMLKALANLTSTVCYLLS